MTFGMDNHGEKGAFHRGRGGRAGQSQPVEGGGSATAALAFFLGMLMQILQEPRILHPPAHPPLGDAPAGALNAPQRTTPTTFPITPATGSAAEPHVAASDAPDENEGSVRTRGTQTSLLDFGDTWEQELPVLLARLQSARPGPEQSIITHKGTDGTRQARTTAFRHSKSAPVRSSQVPTTSFVLFKDYRPGVSEPSQMVHSSSENSTHVRKPVAKCVPTDTAAPVRHMPYDDLASALQLSLGPHLAAEANDADVTSDTSDSSVESGNARTGVTRSQRWSHGSSDTLQIQLAELLSKFQKQVGGRDDSLLTATAEGRGFIGRASKATLPQSNSAPSRSSQLRTQLPLGTGTRQQDHTGPSPPWSPLSDESLSGRIAAAYKSWRPRRHASAQVSDTQKAASRMVRRSGPEKHHNRRSWPGRGSDKIPSLTDVDSSINRQYDTQTSVYPQGHGPLNGRSHVSFSGARHNPGDDSLESSGEDSAVVPSPSGGHGRRGFQTSRSAPSPLRSLSASAEDQWRKYSEKTRDSLHTRRVASSLWPQAGSERPVATRRQTTVSRPYPGIHPLDEQDIVGSPGIHGPLVSSSAPQFWTGTHGVNCGFTVGSMGEPQTSGSMAFPSSGLPPVNMTVQVYNHPADNSCDRGAAAPSAFPASGYSGGRENQKVKKTSGYTRRDRASSTGSTRTRRHLSHPPQVRQPTFPVLSPQRSVEGSPDPRSHGDGGTQAQNAIPPRPSVATSGLGFPRDDQRRGKPSASHSTTSEKAKAEGSHQRGVTPTSGTAAAGSSSADVSVGTRTTRASFVRDSRIPISARRASSRRTSISTSPTSLPHTLRSGLGSHGAAAASASQDTWRGPLSSVPFQITEHHASLGAVANVPSKGSETSPYSFYTAPQSQGRLLSLPSAYSHSGSTGAGAVPQTPAEASTIEWTQPRSQAGIMGATPRLPQSDSVLEQTAQSTARPRTAADARASGSLASQPVEDEYLG